MLTKCMKENENAILRTKRVRVRQPSNPCAIEKLLTKKTTQEQMNMLSIKETADGLAKAKEVR